MKTMKNKVYGVIGISSIMSNFNADFTGNPRSFEDKYYATAMSLKYSTRDFWKKNGELLLYIKSMKQNEKDLKARTLKDRYEYLFNSIKKNSRLEIMTNVFKCIDALCYGSAFPIENNKFSIAGAVQITDGINLYEGTETIRQEILSPFSTDENKDSTTLGSRIVANEAHYFFGLSINPNNYNEYVKLLPEFHGFTVDAYEKLKDALLFGATGLQSLSKVGSENEFALFVKCNENAIPNMANLHTYIDYSKDSEDGLGKIDLTRLYKYLESYNNFEISEKGKKEIGVIEDIEIYYNPYTTKLIVPKTPESSLYNILNKQSITVEEEKEMLSK